MMYSYQAFGLTIHSELHFPELLPFPDVELPDLNKITIRFGEVSPHGLDSSNPSNGLFYQVTALTLWLHIPQIARFLITQGNQIIIDPVTGIDQDSIRVYVLGSCMGALLMQRDLFLLHGNAVKIGKNCVSFIGHSGAGKSTLSGALFKRGYSILADDICAISAEGQVVPSFPQIKLWQDAAKKLNIDTQALRRIRPGIEKFAVPLEQQFHSDPLPLKVVYVLNTHNKDEVNVSNLKGMQKLLPLQNNIYRKNYLKGSVKELLHFKQCAQVANRISLGRITRPHDGFKLDELVHLIENDLTERGLLQ